jgi:hypothetical protein
MTVSITYGADSNTESETYIHAYMSGVEEGIAGNKTKRQILYEACRRSLRGRREPRPREQITYLLHLEGSFTREDIQIVDGTFFDVAVNELKRAVWTELKQPNKDE